MIFLTFFYNLAARKDNSSRNTEETFTYDNMNGRMYDPVMSSFLSVDRFVQNPMSAQGFNRYAYCMYNPLRYVDPTGWRSGSGGGHSPDNPPHYVYMDGWSGYLIDEVTIVDSRIFNFEIDYTSHYNAGGGSDNPWNEANNGQPTGYKSGSGGGNGNHGGYSNNTTTSQNVNVEIGSKLLIPFGVMRDLDFNGNKYTGGKNSFGKMMSKRYTNAGRVLGLVGVGLSYYQFDQATTTEEKLEYGFDTFIGFAGVVAPEFFGLPATIWFLGGKQVTFWYSRTTIIPMIENGINPGLMENQPFK